MKPKLRISQTGRAALTNFFPDDKYNYTHGEISNKIYVYHGLPRTLSLYPVLYSVCNVRLSQAKP